MKKETITQNINTAKSYIDQIDEYVEGLAQGAYPFYEVKEFLEDCTAEARKQLMAALMKIG